MDIAPLDYLDPGSADGDALDQGQWRYATAVRGEAYMLRDAKRADLSKHAAAKLEEAMNRVQRGTNKPGEIGKVRGDILELRVNQDKRWYRLLFARDGDGYVALLLGAKKTNQMEPGWIDTAAERLGEHREKNKQNKQHR